MTIMIPPRSKNRIRERGGGEVVVVVVVLLLMTVIRNNTNKNESRRICHSRNTNNIVPVKVEGSGNRKVGNKASHTHKIIKDQTIIVTYTQSSSLSPPLRLPSLSYNSLPCSSIFYPSNKDKMERKGLVVYTYRVYEKTKKMIQRSTVFCGTT